MLRATQSPECLGTNLDTGSVKREMSSSGLVIIALDNSPAQEACETVQVTFSTAQNWEAILKSSSLPADDVEMSNSEFQHSPPVLQKTFFS